jgi:tight adherence protein B
VVSVLKSIFPDSIIKFLVFGGIFAAVFVLVRLFYKPLADRMKSGFQEQIELVIRLLDRDFVKTTPMTVRRALLGFYCFWGVLGMGFFFPNILFGSLAGVVLIAIATRLPKIALDAFHNRRVGGFNNQLVDALTLMSNGLKSGLNITQTIDLVSHEMPNPISQEFGLILSENQLGTTIEDAFENLAKRIPTEDVEMLATAVTILRETGGNLAETFDTITYTIRERIKIKNKIGALVSQGLIQGIIIMLMPFGLAGMLYMIDPNQILPMFTTPLGLVMIGMMIFLQILGGFAIWKIIDVKV